MKTTSPPWPTAPLPHPGHRPTALRPGQVPTALHRAMRALLLQLLSKVIQHQPSRRRQATKPPPLQTSPLPGGLLKVLRTKPRLPRRRTAQSGRVTPCPVSRRHRQPTASCRPGLQASKPRTKPLARFPGLRQVRDAGSCRSLYIIGNPQTLANKKISKDHHRK